jgi:hypothetical protein
MCQLLGPAGSNSNFQKIKIGSAPVSLPTDQEFRTEPLSSRPWSDGFMLRRFSSPGDLSGSLSQPNVHRLV